jgi:hypothetical protein
LDRFRYFVTSKILSTYSFFVCLENKFIDYLRDVQMDRWLDWTMERDQEPYIDQAFIVSSSNIKDHLKNDIFILICLLKLLVKENAAGTL